MTASPDGSGRHWNNIATDSAQAPAGGPYALIAEDGSAAGVQIFVAGFGSGANANGTTSPDAALGPLGVAAAARDSFFVPQNSAATLTLSGLASNGIYRLTFFASRDAADTRVTRFTVGGQQGAQADLQTSGAGIGLSPEPGANRSAAAVAEPVRPSSGGVLTVTVQGLNGAFGYLGALRLERTGTHGPNQPPQALSVGWEGAPVAGRTLAGRYVYADADNDPEGATQVWWESAETPAGPWAPVPGATGSAFTPGGGLAGRYLRFAVMPVAQSGAGPSGAVVYSAGRGPVRPAGSLATFHVGNSFTRWGDVPRQLTELSAAAGLPHTAGDQLTDTMGLQWHWDNGLPGGAFYRGTPVRTEIATGTWDALVIQPQSRQFEPGNLPAMISQAALFRNLAHANGARLYLYVYWPYRDEPAGLQTEINAAFETARAALSQPGQPVRVIPVGEAMRRVVEEIEAGVITGMTRADFYQDPWHPTSLGYYLSALVHYSVLHRRNPAGLPNSAVDADEFEDGPVVIPPALAAHFQRVAWEVARSYPGTGVTAGRFEEWAAAHLPAGQRGAGDDPYGEGAPNLVRWAFGLGPGPGAGRANLPAVTGGAGASFVVTYTRGSDAEDAGVRYEHEWSETLGSWSPAAPPGTLMQRYGQTVVLTVPNPPPRLFFRCRVVLPD